MNNLNNNTTLDSFMVKPESKKVLSKDNEGVYLVGFNGMFRTSRR
jgi:hypothetical protein